MKKLQIGHQWGIAAVSTRAVEENNSKSDPLIKQTLRLPQLKHLSRMRNCLYFAFVLFCLISCQKEKDFLDSPTSAKDAFARKYGLIAIDKKDIPKGVVPAEYSSIEEAEKFFGEIKKMPKNLIIERQQKDSSAVIGSRMYANLPSKFSTTTMFFDDPTSVGEGYRYVEFRGTKDGSRVTAFNASVFLEYRRYTDGGFYLRTREDVIVIGYGFGPNAYVISDITSNYFNGSDSIFSCNGFAYAMINGTNFSFWLGVEASGSCGTSSFGHLTVWFT